MIVSTEAIVLRAVRYGDTSKIVTLYTRDGGKVSVIAKGAAGSRPRFGAALEPMSHSHVVYYYKNAREVQTLSQADVIRQFQHMIDRADTLALGFAVVEFVHAAIHGEEEHAVLFDVMLHALGGIDASDENAENVLVRFLLDFSALLGFGIDTGTCIQCRRSLLAEGALSGPVRFVTRDGGFTCTACAAQFTGRDIPARLVSHFSWLERTPSDTLTSRAAPHQISWLALRILQHHYSSHIEGMRKIKALEMLPLFSQSFH